MNFHAFKEWIALGLMSGGVYVLFSMNQNIGQLNITMAVITERVIIHDKILDKHESQIESLQKK